MQTENNQNETGINSGETILESNLLEKTKDDQPLATQELSFEEMIAQWEGLDPSTKAVLEPREAQKRGNSTLPPNLDPKRHVKFIKPNKSLVEISMRKYGNSKTEGGTIRGTQVEKNFPVEVRRLKNRVQIGLLLANGAIIYGYSVISKESGVFYMPSKYFPKDIVLPGKEEELPLMVAGLIIG